MYTKIVLKLVPDKKGGYEVIRTVIDETETNNQNFRKDGATMTATNTTKAAMAATSQLNNDVIVNGKQGKKGTKVMNTHIIGIDHGYKNMKGANTLIETKLSRLESKPNVADMGGVVEFEGKYYTIYGDPVVAAEHKIKSDSDEYYILTLAVLGEEFIARNIASGPNKIHVRIGCGLPQQWYEDQQESFKAMLLKNKEVTFSYSGNTYNVVIDNVTVMKQGLMALPLLSCVKDKQDHIVLVDIGGETVDIIVCEKAHAIPSQCRFSKGATISLLKNIGSRIEVALDPIPESDIINYICSGSREKEPKDDYEKEMQSMLIKYSDDMFIKLKEFKINTDHDQIVFLGGGAAVIKSFGTYGSNVSFCNDIRINAKAYECIEKQIAEMERK